MTIRPLYFPLGPKGSVGQTKGRLVAFGFVAAGPARTVRETWLDSFDWRFFSQGRALVAREEGDLARLEWLDVAEASPLATSEYVTMPCFARDFPLGDVARLITPLLECRALIPLIRRRVRQHWYHLLDRREKTVLRLVIEESRLIGDGAGKGAGGGIQAAIRLLPVKGYDRQLGDVQRWLVQEIGLAGPGKGYPEGLFQAAGHQPGGYSSKIDVKFAPESSADAALRQLLLTLLYAVEANEAGVVRDLDSEFLHDFRVAIRRARSALSQLKGVFPEAQVTPYRKAFTWLAAATGPTRDLDVYLLALPRFEMFLAAEFRPELAPLKALIEAHRSREFLKLKAVLTGRRYRNFKDRWRQFLETPPAPEKTAENTFAAETPIAVLAAQRIWRLYGKLRKGGRAISQASPAGDLHDLRKQAKKLRYMFEFFKSLYKAEDIAPILQLLKKLQQNLGDIQDYEVEADHLTALAGELEIPGAGGRRAYMAVGMLTAHLTDLRLKARDEFASVFADFDNRKMHRLFVKLFRQPASEGD